MNFAAGSVLLRNEAGEILRVVWPLPDEGVPHKLEAEGELSAARALPSGSYTCVGYRIRARHAGVEWHLSGTSPVLAAVKIEAGQDHALRLNAEVKFGLRLKNRQPFALLSPVQGFGGCALTLYRDGRRLPIGYRLEDAAGEVVAEGPMKFG